jgi:hypothetical protein
MGERKLDDLATILPFPAIVEEGASTDISITPELVEKVIAECEDDAEIRSMLEAYFAANLIYDFVPSVTSDDPFDPIYISALKPDVINANDFSTLLEFSDIKDLSDEIFFDDGLDDD